MGNTTSHNIIKPVNYYCLVCMESGINPNIAGRFYIMNNNLCQCNGCKQIFNKSEIYKGEIYKSKPIKLV